MIFFDRTKRNGFITGAEIISFIVINVLMLTAFGLGSSIRKAQDTKLMIAMAEEKQRQEAIEAARKKSMQKQGQTAAQPKKPEDRKSGVIELKADRPKGIAAATTITSQNQPFKKLPPQVIKKNETVQAQQQKPVKQTVKLPPQVSKKLPVKTDDTSENKMDDPQPRDFGERFASLITPSYTDSFGVELYDTALASQSYKNREIAILRLLNKFNIRESDEETKEVIYYAVDSSSVSVSDQTVEIETGELEPVSNINQLRTSELELKKHEIVSKFLYKYGQKFYAGTNGGLYSIKTEEIPEFSKADNKTVFKLERFLPAQLPVTDTITMCGNGENILFWGTPSTVYMIDLSKSVITDIGLDELFENTNWYSMFYYKEKLFLANYEKIFCYSLGEHKWYYSPPYGEFVETGICEVQNLMVFEDFKLNLAFAITTNNTGIVTGKMPSFDPKALENQAPKKIRPIRKIFNRDMTASKPCYSFNENFGFWVAFDNYETLPCEIIRYDKRTEKYERYNQSEKIKPLYAIDMAVHGRNVLFATNGEDVFAILRLRNNDKNFWFYSFWPIAKVPRVFSLSALDDFVICATMDGKIFKIDVSELIKTLEK